jgi:branched-subunit amino acid ABC-type transport system permease component
MNAVLNLLPHLVNGVSLGLLFALIALGFMLIVGVMETINLAHGSLFALGMYAALSVMVPRLGWFPEAQAAWMSLPVGTRYLLALLLAPLLVGLFGLLLELCLRRTYGRDPLYGLLLTFGAALAALAGIILTPIWGLRPHVGVDATIPAFLIIVLGGIGSFWGAVFAGLLVGLVVGITGAYASDWSILSMYILLVVVLTFRSRGLLGKKTALEL